MTLRELLNILPAKSLMARGPTRDVRPAGLLWFCGGQESETAKRKHGREKRREKCTENRELQAGSSILGLLRWQGRALIGSGSAYGGVFCCSASILD